MASGDRLEIKLPVKVDPLLLPGGSEVRIGHASWNLSARTLAERVRALGEIGLRAVSFYLSPLEIQKGDEDDRVRRLVKSYDMMVTCHNDVGRVEDSIRFSRLKNEMAEIASWHEMTGCVDVVSFDAGSEPASGGRIYNMEATCERLAYALDLLNPLGIHIAIENWLWNSRIEDLDNVARAVPGVGMLLDVGHLLLARSEGLLGGMTVEDYCKEIPMPILELHLHDNDGTADTHSPLNTGILDLSELARGLHAVAFSGIATIEHGGPLNENTLKQIADSATRFRLAMLEEYAGEEMG